MSGNSAWRQTNSLGRVNEGRESPAVSAGIPGRSGRRVRPVLLRGERRERGEVVANWQYSDSDRTTAQRRCSNRSASRPTPLTKAHVQVSLNAAEATK